MPETEKKSQEFAIKYSKEAAGLRKNFPVALQRDLLDIIDRLAKNPKQYPHRNRPISRDGKIFIYAHPQPPLEITYEIDSDNKIIYFIHFAAPVLEMSKPIFISYSHEDTEWLIKLKKWLKPLEQQDMIRIWDDTEIKPGSKWREEINKSLISAKVALLLITQNFLASDFIAKKELTPLLEAAKNEGVKICWIAVSESTVDDTEITEYQAVNIPSEPLDSLSQSDQNKAFRQIYERIKELVAS